MTATAKRAARDADCAHTTAKSKGSIAVIRRASAVVLVRACCRIRPRGGTVVKQRYTLSVMCGRSTYKLT
jgi:hypothetical protein